MPGGKSIRERRKAWEEASQVGLKNRLPVPDRDRDEWGNGDPPPVTSMLIIVPGRADTLPETPFQTARREAWEEIGLADINQPLPRPFRVEHLCELPANLAKTELVVRPCIALLHSYDVQTGESADPEVSLIPKLDAREVAAVFTAPFYDFLKLNSSEHRGEWYRGSWSLWHNSNWRSKW